MNSNLILLPILTLTVLLWTHTAAQAAEPTSAITYQGSLTEAGEPLNGSVDLVFRLYDAAEGGSQIGASFAANEVDVTDGVFTVQLDFGDAVFTGDDRWLEVEVEGIPLTPRQPLTAAPMAHYAHRAASVPGAALFMQDGSAATFQGRVRIGALENLQALKVWGRFASGRNASSSGINSFVGGGDENSSRGTDSFVGGGFDNTAIGESSFVGGGTGNETHEYFSFVGGGTNNRAYGPYSFIGGGGGNKTEGADTFVGGGRSNTARGINSFVGGGHGNDANGENSFVGGGYFNSAKGEDSFVAGGILNIASGLDSFVAGGGSNIASGEYSSIAGGSWNVAQGTTSLAAGNRAHALHNGTFVWADRSGTNFTSTADNQFLIRATGGVGIGTAPVRDLHIMQGNGEAVLPGIQVENQNSGAWAFYVADTGDLSFEYNEELKARIDSSDGSYVQLSDRNAKTSTEPLTNVLEKLLRLEPSYYFVDGTEAESVRSIGLIAQDVQPLFPEVVSEQDGKLGISYSEISVLNTAALIELHEHYASQFQEQIADIKDLKEQCRLLTEENQKLNEQHRSMNERLQRLEQYLKNDNSDS